MTLGIHFIVCLLVGLPPRAHAEGAVLEVDPTALSELAAEEARASADVVKRVEAIRQQSATENKSKFTKIKELFNKAGVIAPGEFKGEVAFGGQCVTQDNQETFYPGLANLYLERDPVLGTQVYFVPSVSEGRVTDPDYANLELPVMQQIHRERRVEKPNFTALQFGLSDKTQLKEILSSSLKNSVLFSYRPPARAVASATQSKSSSSHIVLFNVRMDRAPNGRPYVILQRLCPYYPGCKTEGNTIAEYLNYVDAFAYCYYTKMHFLPKGG